MAAYKPMFGPISHVGLLLMFMLASSDCVKSEQLNHRLQATHGEYMGHKWHIDENHLMWWDSKPYIRYGFTGNGQIDKFIKLGFDQFNVSPSEQLWVFSKNLEHNRQAIEEVDRFTDTLVRSGATYYASLNAFWPWSSSDKLAQENMVKSVFRHSWDVSGWAGTKRSLELSAVTETKKDLKKNSTKAYLFDMDRGVYEDISGALVKITVTEEKIKESPTEVAAVRRCTFFFRPIQLPAAEDLRLTVVANVCSVMVPNVYPSSFPALWKSAVRQHYINGLRSFKKAYAKEGLRGMMFGDEINSHRVSFVDSKTYLDFRDDEIAMQAYRNWLNQKFRTAENLNEHLGTKLKDFGQVKWHICIYPFLERGERDDNVWARINHTFGLFNSAEQLEKIDRLQEEFRIWFFGYWLARYAALAKEIIGDVPVFITSAGIGGNAENYLQIHKQALMQGLDGLVRNHYAHARRMEDGRLATYEVWSDARFPLGTVTIFLDSVQKQSGKTKTYFANEFGWPKRGGFDDFGFGDQFSFPSKQDLRSFLHVLIDNSYKGFNMFKMNPNVPGAQKEVKWFSELKNKILERTINTTRYYEDKRIDREQALQIARMHPRLQQLVREYPGLRTLASFRRQYNVWIVEFLREDTELGFASIGTDGEVLEVEIKPHLGAKQRKP